MKPRFKKIVIRAAIGFVVVCVVLIAAGVLIVRKEIARVIDDDPAVWSSAIAAFEKKDAKRPPPQGVIVFTGSSSIRFWRHLERDMAPLPVIKRGFGGAKMRDVVYHVDRIVIAYEPAAVVLFAGSNDISGFKNDSTPEEILAEYVKFVETVHAELPGIPIYYISITPTPRHWKLWPVIRTTNELIAAYTLDDERLHFIDTTHLFLNEDSRPDSRLFLFDGLHLKRKGYDVWTSAIKPVLENDLYR